MNKQIYKTDHSIFKNLSLLPLIIVTSFALFITSCNSISHKKSAILNLVNAKEKLLKNIEAERSTNSMKKRIERDQTLLEAEWHLREAIRALLEANQAIKRSL